MITTQYSMVCTTTARRIALAVVVQSMSLPCPGPFTSNLSDLACNVVAFFAAVAVEYLQVQLIGDVRPEEQAWVQAWRGPPTRRLECGRCWRRAKIGGGAMCTCCMRRE